MKLSNLGFDQWFEANAAQFLKEESGIARVSAVDRGSYLIMNESGEVPAELSGKLSYQIESPVYLPCVGDWVRAQYYDNDTAAIIHWVFPRKTFLRRKTSGANVDFQMIAANIDAAFIVQSCHFDFNLHRMDRYLVMSADGGVEPIVMLTKTDLITQEELEQKLAIISSVTKAKVIALSSITGRGFDGFRQTLSPGKTYCLLGSSGVGKTTLINRLIGREAFNTKPVSGTGEGTHTTSRRQLIVLSQGAMLIDTPGMRELGLVGVGDAVNMGFEEFSYYPQTVDMRIAAINTSRAVPSEPRSRKVNYLKIAIQAISSSKRSQSIYEMSYLDKRKKDKAFGRFIKSAKKQMKD